jgi:hypothetical protein
MKTLCRYLFTTLGFAAVLFAASFNFTAGARSLAGQAGAGQGRCVLVAAQPPAFMVTLLCR